jgi:CheY-like chemotaxis protein
MANIVVVDDERVIRFLLKEILEKDNHKVRLTDNGNDAMELIREEKPDLLITDIFMPEKNGLELLMDVRKNYPDIRAIAISGDSQSRNGGHKECLEIAHCLGCDLILEKPFTKETVKEAIKQILS